MKETNLTQFSLPTIVPTPSSPYNPKSLLLFPIPPFPFSMVAKPQRLLRVAFPPQTKGHCVTVRGLALQWCSFIEHKFKGSRRGGPPPPHSEVLCVRSYLNTWDTAQSTNTTVPAITIISARICHHCGVAKCTVKRWSMFRICPWSSQQNIAKVLWFIAGLFKFNMRSLAERQEGTLQDHIDLVSYLSNPSLSLWSVLQYCRRCILQRGIYGCCIMGSMHFLFPFLKQGCGLSPRSNCVHSFDFCMLFKWETPAGLDGSVGTAGLGEGYEQGMECG